jgi:hypothetical protein
MAVGEAIVSCRAWVSVSGRRVLTGDRRLPETDMTRVIARVRDAVIILERVFGRFSLTKADERLMDLARTERAMARTVSREIDRMPESQMLPNQDHQVVADTNAP